MTVAVAVAAEGVRVPVARARAQAIARAVLRAEGVRDALISVAFVTSRAIARLNRHHLGHDGSTDVISFGFASPSGNAARAPGPIVGDIYIAPDVARRNARAAGVSVREEIVRLIVHGVLHVAGHDHPTGVERTTSPMWRRQETLTRRLVRSS